MQNRRRGVLPNLVSLVVILAFILFMAMAIWQFIKPPVEYRFELSEISDGVYAYRETVVSSIPAQNYAMATVCDTSGNIYTIKGTVNVVNSNDVRPYAIWEDSNIVNSDTITIYAPEHSVQYLGTTSVGRR